MASDDPIRRLADALGRVGGSQANAAGPLSVSSVSNASGNSEASKGKDAASEDSSPRNAVAQFERLVESLELTRLIQQEQIRSMEQNTSALQQGSSTKGSNSESTAAKAANGVLDAVKSNFLLSPIIGGIMSLFGHGKSEEPPALPTYALPAAVKLDAGFSGTSSYSSMGPVDRGQDGLPRVIQPSVQPQQITVQVQTIDSRSFLDHSEEIARAVREAVLNSNSLNDVVNDL